MLETIIVTYYTYIVYSFVTVHKFIYMQFGNDSEGVLLRKTKSHMTNTLIDTYAYIQMIESSQIKLVLS